VVRGTQGGVMNIVPERGDHTHAGRGNKQRAKGVIRGRQGGVMNKVPGRGDQTHAGRGDEHSVREG